MPKQTDKELGLFFKNARHEQKLTYEELAEKAEMSSRYLKEIENGGRVPSFHKIRKLVRALNVPPEPLFYPNNHTDNLDYQRLLEYSCAVTPQVRQTGNRLSGLAGTAYASLLT